MAEVDVELVAAGYDAVYTGIARSPSFLRLWREHSLGDDYPEGYEHISFLTFTEMRWMAQTLRLSAGGVLADIACGMGGLGLWIARTTGAQLVGVDISLVALEHARQRAVGLQSIEARFVPGTFADTTLATGSADGVMTVDALQYAPDKQAAVDEAARVLRPRGHFVFACFTFEPERVAGVPIMGTDPIADYRPLLEKSAFDVLAYDESENWEARVRRTYQAVIDAKQELTAELGVGAYAALSGEMSLTLQLRPYRNRVLVAAQKR